MQQLDPEFVQLVFQLLRDLRVRIPVASVVMTLAFLDVLKVRKAHLSENWPTTTAQVVPENTTYYKLRGVVPEKLSSFAQHFTEAGPQPVLYNLEAEYEYVVDGKKYLGQRISFVADTQEIERSEVDRIFERYLSKREVMVHYNPDKPEESVLAPETSWRTKATIILLVVLAIGLLSFGGW